MRTFTRSLRLLQALGSLHAGVPALGAALLCAAATPAIAQQAYPATLAGHAVMPALTVVAAPKDAPQGAPKP